MYLPFMLLSTSSDCIMWQAGLISSLASWVLLFARPSVYDLKIRAHLSRALWQWCVTQSGGNKVLCVSQCVSSMSNACIKEET